MCTRLRDPFRLIAPCDGRIVLGVQQTIFFADTVAVVVHRIEELIGGRAYLIEVAPVANDRWRACIVKMPGVPTALMPFYGATPDAAAQGLIAWLTRMYEPAAAAPKRAAV